MFFCINENFSNLYHIAGDKNSLPVNSVTILYKDENEGLWAGSVRGGVFNIKESYIRTYKDCPLGYINGLSEKSVTSLFEEPNGRLWIGTDGGGINLYEPQTGDFKHFYSTYGDKVVSIAPISEKELIVSVYTKGLFLFDTHTEAYRPFLIINDSINFRQCFYGYIPRAHRVTKNKIYILSKDIWIYDINNRKFSPIKTDKNYQLPTSVMAYSDEKMSLTMSGNKVFQITNKNDSIQPLFQIDEKETITAIDCDGQNRIWVGTTAGIGYYNLKEKRYSKIDSQLFSDISALRYDPSSERVWICAQNQLYSYCIKDDKFIQWNRSDGFHPNEIIFTYQQRTMKKHRYLYFGGIEGLVQINTDIPEPNEPYPEIELCGVELNGQLQTSDINIRNIKIPWKYNTLILQVHIKNKDIFQRVPFRYIIKGDVDKSIESYHPMLELSNLSPGKYHIEVSCMTKDGNYTMPIHLTDIHVTPPWYKTDWFIILCCIFLTGGIIVGMSIFNIRKEVKIQKRLKEYRQYFNEKKIDFLIHINHELRTPLTLIYAPLKRLIDKNETQGLPSYLMPQLQLIFNQAQYMREIVDMVLDWNSMEAGYSKLKIQKCKLDEWITNIVKDFTEEARQKGICIKLQMTTDIEEVWFDKQKCHTVLSNLLMNALKFSMPESCITINTRKLENKVRISVVDEGIGIQDSDITNLFTRFYKGNHKEKGSGFGLYYAKTIMEMHGGDIGAYNNTDKGATFYLELPLLDINEKAEATRLLQKEAPIVNTTQDLHFDCTGKTILIVEDEKELREYLIESFTGTFKKVYAADNAISALETCRKKQPSIIVSDVMMPQMDGFELCRQIKNDIRISHIPVILLTARYDQTGITTGYKSGADSYIPKPFDLAFLKVVVGNILKNREKIHSQYVTVTGSPSLLDLTNSKADEDFMKKINAVIHENLSDEGFSVQQLADAMIVSRSSLYSKIKIITGMGVNDYINRLRIEQAMSLLVNTNLNINEISCEVGFTYPRYFSSTFKNMTGMTPKQFRNENRTTQTTDD
jgi:signal transduction histidine kinase/AraC-like DNA-binding protein/ActR/RegA family two-component response regulator